MTISFGDNLKMVRHKLCVLDMPVAWISGGNPLVATALI